jgi:predicted transcriptional regulator
MVKMTFTVDEETVDILRQTAARLKKPQSAVFREAIRDFAQRTDRLSDEEREQKLAILRRIMARKPTGTQAQADAEIAEIRAARRTGGRRTRVE